MSGISRIHTAPRAIQTLASAETDGIVAIDEVENSLHPDAMYTLLDLIDEYAKEGELTVVVTTQSPMVLDWFEASPERVWVMEQSRTPSPVRLSELKNRDWLSHRSNLSRKQAALPTSR